MAIIVLDDEEVDRSWKFKFIYLVVYSSVFVIGHVIVKYRSILQNQNWKKNHLHQSSTVSLASLTRKIKKKKSTLK